VRAYAAAGADGIGVWELKLAEGSDAEALETLEASGLGSASAVPAIPSILPLPLMEGPADPQARIDAICTSVHRLAAFRPSGVVCLTGPGDDRDTVVEGLRTIGQEADRAGVRVGLEPVNRVGGENWTMITSVGEAVELLEDADHPALGIQFDSWHLWNTQKAVEEIAEHAGRFVGVHLADWREPTRNTNDRVLPGDGAVDFGAIVEALRWDGFYDLEIFSDAELPGSLWREEPRSLARRGVESLRRMLSNASA
jgi:sugar phosphate isomerase/epimerase